MDEEAVRAVLARVMARNPEADVKELTKLVEAEFVYMGIQAARKARSDQMHREFPGI